MSERPARSLSHQFSAASSVGGSRLDRRQREGRGLHVAVLAELDRQGAAPPDQQVARLRDAAVRALSADVDVARVLKLNTDEQARRRRAQEGAGGAGVAACGHSVNVNDDDDDDDDGGGGGGGGADAVAAAPGGAQDEEQRLYKKLLVRFSCWWRGATIR